MRSRQLAIYLLFTGVLGSSIASAQEFDAQAASRFAGLALQCVHQEYPNKISHVLSGDADVKPPRELTPSFYGCFDWHSAVHGHWLLARLARSYPEADFAAPARKALAESLDVDRIAIEVEYMTGEGRGSFERPYGLAWLLQLAAELRQWDDPQATQMVANLAPLEKATRDTLAVWLPKLAYALRVGEHSQTAFAFGLILDWARIAGDREMEQILESKIREFYLPDRNCPLSYEPSGQDFLSPCLAEADLVRRILSPKEYSDWLSVFLPVIPVDGSADWLPIGRVTDRSDGKLAHLDGLNISRAWMLEGISRGLPVDDVRRGAIESAASIHRASGLSSVTGEHYEGGHWLGSFATYLVTGRGVVK